MSQAEELAQQLLSEAELKLSSKSIFQTIFRLKDGKEDAIDCYHRAGNLFKLAKNWKQAAISFQTAANLNLEERNKYDAANNFVQASKCYEKYDSSSAINCLLKAIQIYTDMGRFIMAARIHNTIADIYEQNLDFVQASQHFEQAADYFKVEENHSSAKKCLLKVAQYSASEFDDFTKAVDIYQDVAFFDLRNSLLQYSAKENLFKALLCHLCIDVLNAKYAMDFYLEKFPAFEICREYKFVKLVIEKFEEGDVDGFSNVVKEYDDVSRLESWYTKILLKIKNNIKDQPDLL